jgi:arylsulfatase A-like enzyme
MGVLREDRFQDAGYNTFYTGKLFNAHTVENYDSPHGKKLFRDFVLKIDC